MEHEIESQIGGSSNAGALLDHCEEERAESEGEAFSLPVAHQ